MVAVDPYFDKRSGYAFYANPAGSITDAALSNDVNDDDSWDGVWENKAAVNGEGWTVEIRIPFNQIRFPKKDEYVWGVNFRRMIRRKNEQSTFNWSPEERGGLRVAVRPARGHRAASARAAASSSCPTPSARPSSGRRRAAIPFETGHRALGNVGFDLKVGLKSNLTLDATVNPDFGQVEVDPAVLNLSAYETYYEEKRPFFIEGASLFNDFGRGGVFLNANINWPQPTFFYSRRIGRAPQGYVTEDGFARVPDRTTILGAAKLTGKLGGSWNVGWLSALTGPRVRPDRPARDAPVAGGRAVLLLRDAPRPEGHRRGEERHRAHGHGRRARSRQTRRSAGILNKNAFSPGRRRMDLPRQEEGLGRRRLGGRDAGRGERRGHPAAPELVDALFPAAGRGLPRASTRRRRASAAGRGGSTWPSRTGNLLVLANVGAISPGFDPNDTGFQYGGSDIINMSFLPGYQWTKPGKVFRYALVVGGWFRNYDFGGNKIWDGGLFQFQGQLRNFWMFNTMFAYNPDTLSKTLTRGGPLALTPSGYQFDLSVETDSRKPVVFEFEGMTYQRPRASEEWSAQLSARWKPGTNVSVSIGPTLGIERNDVQWVRRVDDALMTSTFGSRYVFGRIDQKVARERDPARLDVHAEADAPGLSAAVRRGRGTMTRSRSWRRRRPTPTTCTARRAAAEAVRRSATTGRAGSTRSTRTARRARPSRSRSGIPISTIKSLRGTVVLRWEYRPGSLLYFVWTQNRADYANPGNLRLGRDLGDLFSAPGDNIFLLKVSYRWNI